MRQQKTSALRKLAMYGFDMVTGSHNFYALLEFDIGDVRTALRKKRADGEGGSLFAFFLKAIGKCLEEYPECNSMINARKTTVFDEVDVNIPIELEREGSYYTKQYIIRNINEKSLTQVASEIEESKKNVNDEKGFVYSNIARTLLTMLPGKIVVALFRALLWDHKRVKDLSGTVFVTSVSMFSNVSGYVIPYMGGPKAVSFAIGSVVRKPVVRKNEIQIREMIHITAVFNHDSIDGAPAARFINALRKYIENDFDQLM